MFVPGEEEVNWNHNLHMIPPSSISMKPKSPDLLNLSDYKKVHSSVKIFFKETIEIFPRKGRVKYFLKKLETVQQS